MGELISLFDFLVESSGCAGFGLDAFRVFLCDFSELGEVFEFYRFHLSGLIDYGIYLDPFGWGVGIHKCLRVCKGNVFSQMLFQ